MKTRYTLFLLFLLAFPAGLMSQLSERAIENSRKSRLPGTGISEDLPPALPAKIDPSSVITWNGNVLHKATSEAKPEEKGLKKMILEAGNEVKNMQKTIASVEQKPETTRKSIFHYRQATESFIDGKTSTIIR